MTLAETVAARSALAAQLLEAQHAALVARAARLDAFADPHFLLREQLVEFRVLLRFGVEQLLLAPLIVGITAGKARQPPAVELDHARRHVVQKTPVVRDEQHAAVEIDQQFLQPFDAGDVEMVGRLIEQQQFGLRDERARERDALLEPARERADARIAIQAKPRNARLDAGLRAPAVGVLEFGLQFVHAIEQCLIAVLAVGHPVRQLVILVQKRGLRAQTGRDRIEHRHLRCRVRAPAQPARA